MKLLNLIVGAVLGFCGMHVFEARADSIASLLTFTNSNGSSPYSGLTLGADGNLYGTTSSGGSGFDGTIFELDSNYVFTTLANFNYNNGSFPPNAMTLGTNGNFYGITYGGGAYGLGTIFEFIPATQTIITLYSFDGTNAANPWASLCLASNGVFYGTTANGGVGYQGYFGTGYGTLFSITHQGVYTHLYSFTNGTDGSVPYGQLVQGTNGNLFGTAYSGGSYGDGTIFEWDIDPGFMPLGQFNGANGANPMGLTLGWDNNFYGVTAYGGNLAGISQGTVFEVMPPFMDPMVLHAFNENNQEGGVPYNRLYTWNGRDFLGTTYEGGKYGLGSIYKLSVSPTCAPVFQTLISFRGLADGAKPESNLVGDRYNNLIGTTTQSTTIGGGTAEGSIIELITPATLSLRRSSTTTLELRERDLQLGLKYHLEYSQSIIPGDWTDWSPSLAATGKTTSVTVPISNGAGYWRLNETTPGYLIP